MKNKILIIHVITLFMLLQFNLLSASTITVGTTGTYPSISAAISALGTITEPVIIELTSDYAQTTDEITAIAGASSVNTVTIRPQTNITISGSQSVLWKLNGCKYVTINGQIGGNSGTKDLTLSNTSTTGITIQFINDACNNTIQYVNLKGVNANTSAGTVTFGSGVESGNDNNKIENCSISAGATSPMFGIYSLGTSNSITNDNLVISNNYIFDYYDNSGANTTCGGYGVFLSSYTNACTISGNSFYQTSAKTAFGNGSVNGAILINNTSGNDFIVKDNYIGGQSAFCGTEGNRYVTGSSSATTQRFLGISVTVGNTSPSYIYNNTFQNLSVFSGNTTPSACISLQGGLIKCGVNTDDASAGNTIGSSSASSVGTNASIIFTGTVANSYFSAIYVNASMSSTPIVVSNNSIGGVTGTSTNITTSSPIISYLSGISVGGIGALSTYTISDNNIGNGATGIDESSMSIQNFAARSIFGIHISANNSTGIVNVEGNNINNLANLAPNSSSTNAGYFGGIVTNNVYTQVNITNNVVRDLSAKICSASNTGTYPLHAGIAVLSQNSANTITQNTVYNLAGAKTMIDGILVANGGGTTVSRNSIFNVYTTSTSSGNGNAGANGIRVVSVGTTYAPNVNVNNNMIRLGYDRDGVAVTSLCPFTGIRDSVTTTAAAYLSYCYNTVYVGGTGVVSGTNPTFAFFTAGASGSNLTRNILNNIFVNARSSVSGSNIHYAFKSGNVNGLNGTLNLDYNDYVANGIGGTLGYVAGVNRTTIAELQTGTSQDSNSLDFNPVFVSSTAVTPDLHISLNYTGNNTLICGLPIESVKTDFDGEQRGEKPVVGADEFTDQTLSPYIRLSESTANISYYKNSNGSVDVFSNVTWTAVSQASWLSVEPSTSTIGNATLTFSAEANPDFSARTTLIIVSNGAISDTLSVIQEARSEIDKTEYMQIILYGQSLALGWQCPRAITTTSISGNYMLGNNVDMQYNNGTAVLNPLVATKWSSGGEQPIVACVNAFSKVYRDSIDSTQKFIAMTGGEGGRTIERLSKECTNSGYYESTFLSILDNTLAALDGKTVSCPAIIYMQGEYNCSASGAAGQGLTPGTDGTLDKDVYKSLLLTLKNNMQADIMEKYGQVQKPLFFIYQTSGKYISSKEMPIVMAQREFASENTDVVLMNPHYALPDYSGGHLSTNGYRWYGEIMAKSLSEVLVRKNTYETLKPTKFDIEGNTIDITYQIPVPPLVFDTWTTPQETNYGFTVYKDGAVVSINDVQITTDNHVLITCNSVLTGVIDIVYAGSTTNGSGNLRDSDESASMYTYYDDSADALQATYIPTTETGGSILGQPYGLQNWSDEFYYSFNVVSSGVNNTNLNGYTTVFPNPATNVVNVIYDLQGAQDGEFMMFDAQGKQIYKQNIVGDNKSVSVKVDQLPSGMYFYNISTNNVLIARSKFIVNR